MLLIDELSVSTLNKCCVASIDDVHKLLEGWNDEPIIIPSLVLSDDNRRIIDANIVACGRMFKEKGLSIDAMRIWDLDEPYNIKISNLNLRNFTFSNGELWSDLVDGSSLGT